MISIVGPEGTKVVARALGMRGLGKGSGHLGLVQEPARRPGHPGGVQGPAKGMAPATGVQGLAKASGPGGGVHGSMGGIAMGNAPGSPVPQSSGDAVWRLTHPDFGTLFVLENRDLEDRELENRDLENRDLEGPPPEGRDEGRPASDPGHRGLPALDVIAEDQVLDALGKALEEAGASPMGPEAWEVLRIEAGAPAFGLDMTEDTIPVEAGIHRRAVDYRKGCYTGQEVIVRIRDRGQVNKRLCRVLLGDIPLPEAGTALFSPHEDRSRGWITSACRSPRFGQTVALGYVKRGLEPGDEVRVGSPDGTPGRVEAL